MYKQKENKIFNSNLPLFFIFCLIGTLYLGFIVNYWYLLFLLIVPFGVWRLRPNKWQILFILITFLCFLPLLIWAPQFSLIKIWDDWFLKVTNNFIFKNIDNFLAKFYPEETSSFIKLILFNIKSKETYIFLNQVVDLGIVWLISSAAFHLSLISRIIKGIFKKQQIISYWINFCFLFIYSFILGFSYGCLRVLYKNVLIPVFKKTKSKRYDQLGLIGMMICFLNPVCFQSYSFLLSFVVCIGTYSVINLSLSNKLLTTLLVNIFAFLIIIPFVIEMNHKIAILTFVNTFVCSYYFMGLFLYFLIFSWLPFMGTIHYWIIRISYVLTGNISFSNLYIYSSSWEAWIIVIYYFIYFVIMQVTYLIVINNKI